MPRRKRNRDPRIIVDYVKCLHIEPGDEILAEPMAPFKCPVCELYSGRLSPVRMPPPRCDDHGTDEVLMEKI
jgi:hypothetical protein